MKVRVKDEPALYDGRLTFNDPALEQLGCRAAIRLRGNENNSILVPPAEASAFVAVWASREEWKALRQHGFLKVRRDE